MQNKRRYPQNQRSYPQTSADLKHVAIQRLPLNRLKKQNTLSSEDSALFEASSRKAWLGTTGLSFLGGINLFTFYFFVASFPRKAIRCHLAGRAAQTQQERQPQEDHQGSLCRLASPRVCLGTGKKHEAKASVLVSFWLLWLLWCCWWRQQATKKQHPVALGGFGRQQSNPESLQPSKNTTPRSPKSGKHPDHSARFITPCCGEEKGKEFPPLCQGRQRAILF